MQLYEVHVVVAIRCLRSATGYAGLHAALEVENSLVLVEGELLLLSNTVEKLLQTFVNNQHEAR